MVNIADYAPHQAVDFARKQFRLGRGGGFSLMLAGIGSGILQIGRAFRLGFLPLFILAGAALVGGGLSAAIGALITTLGGTTALGFTTGLLGGVAAGLPAAFAAANLEVLTGKDHPRTTAAILPGIWLLMTLVLAAYAPPLVLQWGAGISAAGLYLWGFVGSLFLPPGGPR